MHSKCMHQSVKSKKNSLWGDGNKVRNTGRKSQVVAFVKNVIYRRDVSWRNGACTERQSGRLQIRQTIKKSFKFSFNKDSRLKDKWPFADIHSAVTTLRLKGQKAIFSKQPNALGRVAIRDSWKWGTVKDSEESRQDMWTIPAMLGVPRSAENRDDPSTSTLLLGLVVSRWSCRLVTGV